MWKFIPRGLRETLERGLNIHRRPETRVGREKKFNCCILEGFKTITGNGCEQQNEYKNKKSYCRQATWFSAFSCSSALALGWVLSHPSFWKKWLIKDQHPKLNLTQHLAVVLLQPNDKLGMVKCEDSIEYGPKTAEETFNEGVEEFKNLHDKVWAEVENQKGIACLDLKDNRKAFKHFLKSSKLGYTPAEHNLGQCYELGIGVNQDFTKAAMWYQKAAAKGHPTALYNLGVFYAHGWGGLEANTDTARKLIKQAADKGQPNAKAALGRQDKKTTEMPSVIEGLNSNDCDHDSCACVDLSSDPNHIFNLASQFESSTQYDSLQPELVLQLYKMASDLGHTDARSKFIALEAFNSIGLLEEYINMKSKKECVKDSKDEAIAMAYF